MFFRANLGVSIGIFLYSVIVLTSHYITVSAQPTFAPEPVIIKKEIVPTDTEAGTPVVPMVAPRRAVSGG